MKVAGLLRALGAALLFTPIDAQNANCSNVLKPSYSAPVVGSGWIAQLIVNNLTTPRGIIQDSSGHMLVVEKGVGIRRLTFNDNGGTCLEVSGSSSVVENSNVSRRGGPQLAFPKLTVASSLTASRSPMTERRSSLPRPRRSLRGLTMLEPAPSAATKRPLSITWAAKTM